MFKFVHAADIHLASPLRRLEHYPGAPVDRVRSATHQALANLIALAVEEKVHFVLIAGDLYDNDLDDYVPLIQFCNQMAELRRNGIRVFLIRGNHDAANHMSRSLEPPDNVHLFSENRPETVHLEDIQVAVHGQSFASHEVRENLAAGYPDPVKGWFNIGLLHTSLEGSARHDTYAPCSLDHLKQRGYDYWALGHIHQRQLLHEDRPIILYPGNIQGRDVGETGPKGCHLIGVKSNQVVSNEFRPLDIVRWEWVKIDAGGHIHPKEVLQTCLDNLKERVECAEGRLLAARVDVSGVTPAHTEFASRPEHWLSQFQTDCLNEFGKDCWLESLRFNTSLPGDEVPEALPEDALEQLRRVIEELENDDEKLGEVLQRDLRILDRRLPAALKIGEEGMQLTRPEFGRPLLSRIVPLLTHLQHGAGESS
jgi:DNA repair exonuclease SbcCD nuclease subunit